MNKLLYKIELYLVKVIPMIYALLSLLNTTLSYFDIDTVIGFKELSWSKKELDEFVKKCRDSTLLRSKKHSLA